MAEILAKSTKIVVLPGGSKVELELELVQPHMPQKPMLRGEVDARALRV